MWLIEDVEVRSIPLWRRWYCSRPWRIAVGLTIVLNALVLGALVQSKPGSSAGVVLTALDTLMIALLVCDGVLCLLVKRRAVLRDKWDLFDLAVTVLSIAPLFSSLSVLRILRLVRILRLASFLPHGRSTIDALYKAMRRMMAAVVVMLLVFYIFSILCTALFADTDAEHFGSLLRSTASLYELMIFFGADHEVLQRVLAIHPLGLLVFAPFVFVASFALMNLFVGVLAGAVQEELRAPVDDERNDVLCNRLDAMLARLERIEQTMRGDCRDRQEASPDYGSRPCIACDK